MKLLIIKTSAFGDIVHTFKAVQYIHKIAPQAEIHWIVEKRCLDLVAAHPLVHTIHVIDSKKWRKNIFKLSSWREFWEVKGRIQEHVYDAVFDFQGNVKSGILMGLSHSKLKIGFGKKTVPEKPNLLFSHLHVDPAPGLNIREDYLALVESWAKQKANYQAIPDTLLKVTPDESKSLNALAPGSKHIMVCPGSNWENKRLSESSLIAFLQKKEKEEPCCFWIIQNSSSEKVIAERIKAQLKNANVLGKLSLPLLQHFMKGMDLVIAMDSVPLHLAAEAGVPTFSFFGASLSAKYRPLGSQHEALQGACPYHQTFTKRCPVLRSCQTGACIKNLN